MSPLALFIAGAVLVPVVTGIVTGAVMRPYEPWKDTLSVAAVGAGVIWSLLVVAIIVVMILHPTECVHGKCHETDTQAAVQVVFLTLLLPPIYALVLPGAAIGKLLGRWIGHPARPSTDTAS